MSLKRDEILGVHDTVVSEVAVPEWGGTVLIRQLTGRDRDALEQRIQRGGNIRAYVAAISLCDENGRRIFTDGDIDKLGEKSAAALDRIMNAVSKANFLAADDVGELEKN